MTIDDLKAKLHQPGLDHIQFNKNDYWLQSDLTVHKVSKADRIFFNLLGGIKFIRKKIFHIDSEKTKDNLLLLQTYSDKLDKEEKSNYNVLVQAFRSIKPESVDEVPEMQPSAPIKIKPPKKEEPRAPPFPTPPQQAAQKIEVRPAIPQIPQAKESTIAQLLPTSVKDQISSLSKNDQIILRPEVTVCIDTEETSLMPDLPTVVIERLELKEDNHIYLMRGNVPVREINDAELDKEIERMAKENEGKKVYITLKDPFGKTFVLLKENDEIVRKKFETEQDLITILQDKKQIDTFPFYIVFNQTQTIGFVDKDLDTDKLRIHSSFEEGEKRVDAYFNWPIAEYEMPELDTDFIAPKNIDTVAVEHIYKEGNTFSIGHGEGFIFESIDEALDELQRQYPNQYLAVDLEGEFRTYNGSIWQNHGIILEDQKKQILIQKMLQYGHVDTLPSLFSTKEKKPLAPFILFDRQKKETTFIARDPTRSPDEAELKQFSSPEKYREIRKEILENERKVTQETVVAKENALFLVRENKELEFRNPQEILEYLQKEYCGKKFAVCIEEVLYTYNGKEVSSSHTKDEQTILLSIEKMLCNKLGVSTTSYELIDRKTGSTSYVDKIPTDTSVEGKLKKYPSKDAFEKEEIEVRDKETHTEPVLVKYIAIDNGKVYSFDLTRRAIEEFSSLEEYQRYLQMDIKTEIEQLSPSTSINAIHLRHVSFQEFQTLIQSPLKLREIKGVPEWIWLPTSTFYTSTEGFLSEVSQTKTIDEEDGVKKWSLRFVHNNYVVPLHQEATGEIKRSMDIFDRDEAIEAKKGYSIKRLVVSAAMLMGTFAEMKLSLEKGLKTYQRFNQIAEEQETLGELQEEFYFLQGMAKELVEKENESRENLSKMIEGSNSMDSCQAASDSVKSIRTNVNEVIQDMSDRVTEIQKEIQNSESYQFGRYDEPGPKPKETIEGQIEEFQKEMKIAAKNLEQYDQLEQQLVQKMESYAEIEKNLESLKEKNSEYFNDNSLFQELSKEDSGMTKKDLVEFFQSTSQDWNKYENERNAIKVLLENLPIETVKQLATIKTPDGKLGFGKPSFILDNLETMITKIKNATPDITPPTHQVVADKLLDAMTKEYTGKNPQSPVKPILALVNQLIAQTSTYQMEQMYKNEEDYVNNVILNFTGADISEYDQEDPRSFGLVIRVAPVDTNGKPLDPEGNFKFFNDGTNGYLADNNVELLKNASKVHQIHFIDCANGQQIQEAVQLASKNGKLSFVMFMGHGSQNGLSVDGFNTSTDLTYLNEALTDNAMVILKACSTGKGRDAAPNLANSMANAVPGRDFYAASEDAQTTAFKLRVVNNELKVTAIQDQGKGTNILYPITKREANALCRQGKGFYVKKWCSAHKK